MYYSLHDAESEEVLGTVKVINPEECLEKGIEHSMEVSESWDEFNRCEESELDNQDVNDFVTWNNENRVTQIERIFIEYCQPSND
jgi:hypothetical protein